MERKDLILELSSIRDNHDMGFITDWEMFNQVSDSLCMCEHQAVSLIAGRLSNLIGNACQYREQIIFNVLQEKKTDDDTKRMLRNTMDEISLITDVLFAMV